MTQGMPTPSEDDAPAGPPALPERGIDRLVRLAQDHLGMGCVYIAEFVDGRQVYRAVAGDPASFDVTLGAGHDLQDAYCPLMVQGQIPQVIPDSAGDDRVIQLSATRKMGIGAYVGVPLYLPDGALYGSLCGLSHGPESDLNARDAKFLAMLAEFVGKELAEERARARERQAVAELLQHDAFQVALQPVVHLATRRLIGMEALSRFPRHLGAPDAVFAQADRAGLRVELETAAVAKALQLLPLLSKGQSLAVNLSPAVAVELMPRTERDRALDQLVLEITEHAAVENYQEIREHLQPLRARGLRLAIDDAGAGFASLRHVIELRPDTIKVDRALIAGIDADPARRAAVTTFVLLAQDIGAVVVAEGVETRAELATVAQLGVHAAQGYLLARPSVDVDDISRWAAGADLLGEMCPDSSP